MQHLFRELSVYGFVRENCGDVNVLDDLQQLIITWIYQQFIIGQKVRIINLKNPRCVKYNGYEGFIVSPINKKQQWGVTIAFNGTQQIEHKLLGMKSHNIFPVQSHAQLNRPTNMTVTPIWAALAPYGKDKDVAQPIKIDARNFAILPAREEYGRYNWCYSWSKLEQTWSKWAKYPSGYSINPHTASFTVDDFHRMKTMHVMDNSNRLLSYHPIHKQWGMQPVPFPKYIFNPRLVWAYNEVKNAAELHVICNEYKDMKAKVVHYYVQPFNPNRKCTKMHEFKDIAYPTGSGPNVLYVPKRQIIILYDESSTTDNENLSTMHIYSVIDQTWHKRTVNIPKFRSQFGFVATDDGQYVIILGGIYGEDASDERMLDDILIWDLDTDRVDKSIMSCPFAGPTKGVIMGGSDEWCSTDSKTMGTVDAYILDVVPELYHQFEKFDHKWIIYEMVVPETVHVLDESGNHWEMDLYTILTTSK